MCVGGGGSAVVLLGAGGENMVSGELTKLRRVGVDVEGSCTHEES